MKATWTKEDYTELLSCVSAAGKHVYDLIDSLEKSMLDDNAQVYSLPWYKRFWYVKHTFCKGSVTEWSKEDWKLYHRENTVQELLDLLDRIENCIKYSASSITLSEPDIRLIQKYSKIKS